jgi:GT2 family glycosyltransferase
MNPPRASIIVLNWNGRADTLDCLRSLSRLNYPNYETVVVDNGSCDGSVDAIAAAYRNTTVLCTGENLGFAGGNNVGIRHALDNGAEYVWLLNNDTAVEPDSLTNLLNEAEKDRAIGIAGSKIYYFDSPDKIWFAGADIDWWKGASAHVGIGKTDTGQFDEVRPVDRVTGCSMLVRREVCEKIGLLDEEFFLYVEEVDWCVRARRAGFTCVLVPSSVVYHKISSSASKVGNWDRLFDYYDTRNFLYLIKKSFRSPLREIILFRVVCRKLRYQKRNSLRMLLSPLCASLGPEPSESPALFAVRDFLRNRMGKLTYEFH